MQQPLNNIQVFLVTGGWDSDKDLLATTEVYQEWGGEGEWRSLCGALPRPMQDVRVMTLSNRVLLFGEEIIATERQLDPGVDKVKPKEWYWFC